MNINRKKFGIVLFPISLLYSLIVRIRNLLFNIGILKETTFKLPVISIGNITVGGTGKTPHVEYLTDLLQKTFRVGVLSRGYKRKSKGFVLASSSTVPEEIGDEPFQIKQKFPGVSVAVCSKRVEGIYKLNREISGLDVIILDDAFQHRYVKAGLSILLIDYNRPLDRDHMLPYGDLREPANESHRANIVVVTKVPEKISPGQKKAFISRLNLTLSQKVYFTSLSYLEPVQVFKSKHKDLTFEQIKNQNISVILLTGIANPGPLYEFVKGFATEVDCLTYADHHIYTKKDLGIIESKFGKVKSHQKVILTTEKDAVRFSEFKEIPETLKEHLYFVPIQILFQENEDQFINYIITYVEKNNRGN